MSGQRRDKGTGCVTYNEKEGVWKAILRVDGKRLVRNAKTEREAKQKLRDLIRNQETLASQSKGTFNTMSFDRYAAHWLENDKRDNIAPSSLRNLSYDLTHYVSPEIGEIPVSKITTEDIQNLIRTMTSDGRALSTQKRVKSAIKSCLDYAVEKGDIPMNPCLSVKLPSKRAHPNLAKKPICVLSEQELRQYTQRATEVWPNGTPVYRIGWGLILMLATGMRREEAAALEWADVDINSKLIRVHQVASFVEEEKDGKKTTRQTIIPVAKSDKGNRHIPLNGTALKAIGKLEQTTGGYRYVFGVSKDDPINMNTLSRTNLRVMRSAGITRPDKIKTGLHALRHTFCSYLIMTDPPMDIKTISEIMGHSDIGITLNIYGHIFEERKHKAVTTADFVDSYLEEDKG